MKYKDLKNILDERKLTKKELKKREEIAQAIERDNPSIDMSKKMAIATAQAKKSYDESEINEVSNYDIFVAYLHSIGMDPERLKGPAGHIEREKIKNSPAFKLWKKTTYGESFTDDSLDVMVNEKMAGKSFREVHKEYISKGFVPVGQTGSHIKYKHPDSSVKSHPDNLIVLPKHNNDVDPNIFRQNMKKINSVLSSLPIKESKAEKIISANKKSKEKIGKPSEPIEFYGGNHDKVDAAHGEGMPPAVMYDTK